MGGVRPQSPNGEAHTAGGEVGVNAKGGHRDCPVESHLPPLYVTPKSMASRTRRTSPRSRSSSKESNPLTNPSNRLADIQTVLTVTQDVVVDSSQNEEISEIRSRG